MGDGFFMVFASIAITMFIVLVIGVVGYWIIQRIKGLISSEGEEEE